MGYSERQEYLFLFRYSKWTPETVKRLADLREWKDRDDVPESLRATPHAQCRWCGTQLPPHWYVSSCPDCDL